MSSTATQTLTCVNCGESWTRPAQPGRPRKFCDNCRRLGAALTANAVAIKPEPIKVRAGHHREFGTLLAVCEARVPAMLVGPAGSGKSTAGRQVANALGLSFVTESCSPMMTKYDLLGYMDANGRYVPGIFRNAFENGGVILLDEMDASNPAVLVTINLLASVNVGETVTFPDGTNVARHADFVLIAGCNTYGDGASSEYVGREQIDAATLDRFAAIEWAYDESLEIMAAGSDAAEWVAYVQNVRKAAAKAGVDLLVTPRASINGAVLLRKGMARKTVENLTVWKGISKDARRSVERALNGTI